MKRSSGEKAPGAEVDSRGRSELAFRRNAATPTKASTANHTRTSGELLCAGLRPIFAQVNEARRAAFPTHGEYRGSLLRRVRRRCKRAANAIHERGAVGGDGNLARIVVRLGEIDCDYWQS